MSSMNSVIHIVPTTADIIIGVLMLTISILCVIPNVIVIKAIQKDKELSKLNAYQFMLFMAYIDTLQLVPHAITGIFNAYQTTFTPLFAKLLGPIVTPCYVVYSILTVILSLNRLTQLCFPRIDEIMFSKKGMKFWFFICAIFFIGFAIALATPFATIRYIPQYWSWAYDYSYPGSDPTHTTAMVIELAGIPIAGLIYLIVFGVLIAKRKKYKVSKNYKAEMKILIQAVVITGYCSILNVFWHFYDVLLPATNLCYAILNFMWIINCAVNPIVYIIVNAAIRRNTKIRSIRSMDIVLISPSPSPKQTKTNNEHATVLSPIKPKSQGTPEIPPKTPVEANGNQIKLPAPSGDVSTEFY